MKRFMALMLGAFFVLSVAKAPVAAAGWFGDKKPQRTEKPDWMKNPRRFEGVSLSFIAGTLQQDGATGWKLGDAVLRFSPDCSITTDGAEKGSLDAGRQAIVMGTRVGDMIFAWSVRVKALDLGVGSTHSRDVRLKPSEMNKAVGEITRAPM